MNQMIEVSNNLDLFVSFATLISAIGTLIAIIVSILALKTSNRIKKSDNLIELRKLFNEESRTKIHQNLRNREEIKDWVALDDYLGTFELCNVLIKQKNLDENYFIDQYGYRLLNILANDSVIIFKLMYEQNFWKNLYELINRLYPNLRIDELKDLWNKLDSKYDFDSNSFNDLEEFSNLLEKDDKNRVIEKIKEIKNRAK